MSTISKIRTKLENASLVKGQRMRWYMQ